MCKGLRAVSMSSGGASLEMARTYGSRAMFVIDLPRDACVCTIASISDHLDLSHAGLSSSLYSQPRVVVERHR